jgi:hypothetical protein
MRRLIALGVVALVVAALVVAQLVLPGVAAQLLRDRLSRSGQVLSVEVDAFPAIQLLWHHADKVVIRMGRYRQRTPANLPATLGQVANVGTLNASAQEFDDGLLRLHNASLVKRGNTLNESATVTEADLRSALPILSSVTPVASAGGSLTLRGTASLFGVAVTADATVAAQNGNLVVSPNLPFGGLATITLFSDPGISVDSVSASPVSGGFSVRGTATLH